jgi:hypothetical protein
MRSRAIAFSLVSSLFLAVAFSGCDSGSGTPSAPSGEPGAPTTGKDTVKNKAEGVPPGRKGKGGASTTGSAD